MATRRYKISRGEQLIDVVDEAGAAVNSDDFEFTIELANNPSKSEVLLALEKLKQYITSTSSPAI